MAPSHDLVPAEIMAMIWMHITSCNSEDSDVGEVEGEHALGSNMSHRWTVKVMNQGSGLEGMLSDMKPSQWEWCAQEELGAHLQPTIELPFLFWAVLKPVGIWTTLKNRGQRSLCEKEGSPPNSTNDPPMTPTPQKLSYPESPYKSTITLIVWARPSVISRLLPLTPTLLQHGFSSIATIYLLSEKDDFQ